MIQISSPTLNFCFIAAFLIYSEMLILFTIVKKKNVNFKHQVGNPVSRNWKKNYSWARQSLFSYSGVKNSSSMLFYGIMEPLYRHITTEHILKDFKKSSKLIQSVTLFPQPINKTPQSLLFLHISICIFQNHMNS